ncbi:MAG: PqqD family protein, partial [Gammaproteobacteria bacterium]|nr:PqqD family protein [Gammaproteobacteria bacterium]
MLILDLDTDKIHQLNPTACFIWSKCDGTCNEKELAALLSDHYEVDIKTAENDVVSTLDELQKLELIELA